MTYIRLESVRLYERIVAQIRSQIVADELKDGDRLPNERELAERFGVSRTVVREAIKALAKEGLIDVRHGSGTFVSNRTSEALSNSLDLMLSIDGAHRKLADLVEIREIFEPSIAALAAERATEDDLSALDREIAIMDRAMDDVDGFVQADHRFHLALSRASHNSTIVNLLNPIVDLLHDQRKRIFFVEQSASSAQHHHKRILEAVRSRDAGAAREAMQSHLRQVKDDIAALSVQDK